LPARSQLRAASSWLPLERCQPIPAPHGRAAALAVGAANLPSSRLSRPSRRANPGRRSERLAEPFSCCRGTRPASALLSGRCSASGGASPSRPLATPSLTYPRPCRSPRPVRSPPAARQARRCGARPESGGQPARRRASGAVAGRAPPTTSSAPSGRDAVDPRQIRSSPPAPGGPLGGGVSFRSCAGRRRPGGWCARDVG
jgi:hypothetical protein